MAFRQALVIKMFNINDSVVYNTIGVCKIVDIRTEKFRSAEEQEYYVLKPFFDSNSITYVSTTDEELVAKIRPILTRDEINSLIQGMPEEESIWISDDRERDREYSVKLHSGDCHELVKLIKTLYLEKDRKKGTGKRLNATDTKIMTTAEKLLYDEFAIVLGIKPAEVVSFIQAHIPGAAPGLETGQSHLELQPTASMG